MKKLTIVALFSIILISCSNRDEAFCDCMSAGEELNNYAQKLMEHEATKTEAQELKVLRDKKQAACKAYETMDGPTMIEKKKACEN